MESKRQKQVARLIQKDLGEIFQREFRSLFAGNFVTITDVKVSPDLSVAKVYLSFLKNHNRESLLEEIKEQTKKIRGMFGMKAGKQLRIIPHFSFFIDDTAEYAQKIEELFANIHIPPAEEEEDS
ncbi:30S ribosome-binding factor RbfA [Leadbetterella byssophila]|jgi:ribosome-binding factor A|uniref:Ribosome-binding factor A n=1 Tax=Leadbetterella byssophila (strain DSM 17132 / JCM 16389 / KACC 11308 / NBRC 106382 / 4M15) TaxID=649349 RepID=E4RWS2_LEAB4|nr:30S ribosome-binding factor RbfA [Leadbetterella byssophila]ADQ16241.1 ribosome-binding factor A [Leadbetterella byssophila DSM 17132]